METIAPPQEVKWASSKACRAKNLQVSAMGRGCAKTIGPSKAHSNSGHLGSISPDFSTSTRALSNLRGVYFEFSHSLDPKQTWADRPEQLDLPRSPHLQGRLPGVSAHNSGEVVGVQVRAPDAGYSMAVWYNVGDVHGARLSEEHIRLIDR